MPGSWSFTVGPLVAAAALGLIIAICRWVFSTSNRITPTEPTSTDLGLLTPVTTVRTRADADMLREVLREAGIRAGVSEAGGELQVLVFDNDLARARQLVSR